MNLSRLKYSAWISLGLLAVTSCRSPEICISGEASVKFRKSVCDGSFEKSSFKANVSFKGSEIPGIMLIKKAPGGDYRIAFYNELGMTYFEGSIETASGQNKLAVIHIAPVLDHKIFMKNFTKCLNAVFCHQPQHVHASFSPLPTSPTRGRRSPCSPNSPPSQGRDNLIMVYLRNGFSLELSPQK